MKLFNYDKEGPGVSKDGPKKKGIFLFFELLSRKFFDFVKISTIYSILSIPMLVLGVLLGGYFTRFLYNIAGMQMSDTAFTMGAFFYSAVLIILLGSGPASASLAYFNRSAVRETHTYIFSDAVDNLKKNFAQGIIAGIFNLIISTLLSFGILFYLLQYTQTHSTYWLVFMSILIVATVIFCGTNFYLYQMMITFSDSITRLYKNSLILCLTTLPQCLGLLILVVVITNLLFSTIVPVVSAIICCIGLTAILRFAIEFYTARRIQTKLLDNIEKDK